jgi:hypothetical protein
VIALALAVLLPPTTAPAQDPPGGGSPPAEAERPVITVQDHLDHIDAQADAVRREREKPEPDEGKIRRAQRRAREAHDRLRRWLDRGRDGLDTPLTDAEREKIRRALRALAEGNAVFFGYPDDARARLREDQLGESPGRAAAEVRRENERARTTPPTYTDPDPPAQAAPADGKKAADGARPGEKTSQGPSVEDLRHALRWRQRAGAPAVFVPGAPVETPLVPALAVPMPPAGARERHHRHAPAYGPMAPAHVVPSLPSPSVETAGPPVGAQPGRTTPPGPGPTMPATRPRPIPVAPGAGGTAIRGPLGSTTGAGRAPGTIVVPGGGTATPRTPLSIQPGAGAGSGAARPPVPALLSR